MAVIVSPCEKVCLLDEASGLCRGCGRNLDEIARWSAFSDTERAEVMARLPHRLATLEERHIQTAVS